MKGDGETHPFRVRPPHNVLNRSIQPRTDRSSARTASNDQRCG
jgi:hypothetical protein